VRLLGPYHWVIGNDPRGWLPVVDPAQRETMLSLGVQFVLRLGYVDSYAAPVSPRRPVEWFVRA
jgi:hypothetical protein